MKYDFQVVVSVIITNKNNQVLLAKRADDEDVYPGLWGIPGGKIDETDPSIEAGLSREVMEEVGITISDITLLQNNVKRGETNKLYMVFTATHAEGIPTAKEEVVDVAWVEPSDIDREVLTPFTYELIHTAIS